MLAVAEGIVGPLAVEIPDGKEKPDGEVGDGSDDHFLALSAETLSETKSSLSSMRWNI